MDDILNCKPTVNNGLNIMAEQFTLRNLLLRKDSEDKNEFKLPKVNVITIEDKNGTSILNGNSAATLNMNQRMNQMKAQKELTSVQMYSQRMVRLKMTQSQRKNGAPWFGTTVVVPQGLGSSSTPTVPYSTADILYGSDVNRREGSDDLRQNSVGELDKGKDLTRQRSKELDSSNNRRPSSKSGNRRSISIDAVAFDKECDPLKSLSSTLPPTKPTNHFRPNGIRTNLLKGEPAYSQKPNGAAVSDPSNYKLYQNGSLEFVNDPGRDQDDLIATGTEWGYNSKPTQTTHQPQLTPSSQSSGLVPVTTSQQPLSSGRELGKTGISSGNNTNNAYPAKVASSSSSSHQSMSSTNNTMVPTRKYASNNVRPIVVQNNVSGKKVNNNNNKVEEDPKYTDPMIGAPASFQQRIIELGALEGDTVRWERTKRLKKKKQDRDS